MTILRPWLAAAGVASGALLGFGSVPLWVAFVAGPAGLAMIVKRRVPTVALCGLFLVSGAIGFGPAHIHARPGHLERAANGVPRCDVAGRVLESSGLGTLVAVERASCTTALLAHPGVAVMDDGPGDPGATFRANGWLVPLATRDFDLARRRLGAEASLDPVEVDPIRPPRGPHAVAAGVRASLRNATQEMDGDTAGLVRGVTIGDTEALSPEAIFDLRRAGLTHLLAVSGSNVAIVLAAAGFLVRRTGHRVRIWSAAAALATFVLVVGPEPSVLRAGVMAAIALATVSRSLTPDPLALLGVGLAALIAARPGIVFSAGLHLSAAATAGIVLFTPPLERRLERLPRLVALPLAVTLGAQFGVAPVLASTFGELSLTAPLANLLAVPAVAPLTVAGLAAALLGVVLPSVAAALLHALEPFARWILWVGDRMGSPSWASMELPAWSGLVLAVPVCAAGAIVLRARLSTTVTGAREDGSMSPWTWTLHDAAGTDLRTTEMFESKDEAEAWMGREWAALLEEGAETVSLVTEGKTVYRMGLREA